MIYGIDLGTSNSCICYVDENAKPIVIKNLEGNLTTPSIVYYDEDENDFIIGDVAKEIMKSNSDNAIVYIKREMGKDAKFYIGESEYSPEKISSIILKGLISSAKQVLIQEGKFVDDEVKAVITCPAYFGVAEKDSTKKAAELAGIDLIQIITEPTAAAFAYGLMSDIEDKEKKILVYDLGGGTFDITIMSIRKDDIEVIATGGDYQLGGKNWDDAIISNINDSFYKQFNCNPVEDNEVLAELTSDVEKAKKILSSKAKAFIKVNYNGHKFTHTLTRESFEQITNNLTNRTIDMVDKLLKETESKIGEFTLDEILLVGGSSKMPQIVNKMEKYGVKLSLYDPDEAVAKGAALYAHSLEKANETVEKIAEDLNISREEVAEKIRTGNTNDIDEESLTALSGTRKVKNVASRSYGVETYSESQDKSLISNIIKKNDAIPTTSSRDFHTIEDGQSNVVVKIYESTLIDDEIALEMGNLLAEATLELPVGFKKEDIISVSIKITNEGLLEVTATEKKTNTSLTTNVELKKNTSLSV